MVYHRLVFFVPLLISVTNVLYHSGYRVIASANPAPSLIVEMFQLILYRLDNNLESLYSGIFLIV